MSPARLDRALRGDTPRGLEAGVTVVDVRSPAGYEQAHLPGALHIPLEELPERADELDRDQTIVFYVLSSGEKEAARAAMALYELGFTHLAVLEGGIQRWYADGYAIEGTWITPTPEEVGPPWALTPLATGTAVAGTPTLPVSPEPSETPTFESDAVATPTEAATPTKTE